MTPSQLKAATVLVIDDSESIRASLDDALQNIAGISQIFTAADAFQGIKILREQKVDVVLCDMVMPGMDGLKFIGLKASDPTLADIPVILLTSQEKVENKVRALEAGAADYLTKPCEPAELVARVKVHLKVKNLQDQLRQKNEDLERLIRTDPLTGAANRRYFMEILAKEYHRTTRYGRPLGFFMLDIDHFKRVNDTHGHQAGDDALVLVAKTLLRTLRVNDLVSRYGGEEFAIILPETNLDSSKIAGERCRKQIETVPVEAEYTKFSVTVSIGVASLPNENIKDMDTLIKSADDALYQAKRSGRNRVVVAT